MKISTVDGLSMTPDETALLAAFRAMDSSTRNDALCALQSMASFRPRRGPVLALVKSNQLPRPEAV